MSLITNKAHESVEEKENRERLLIAFQYLDQLDLQGSHRVWASGDEIMMFLSYAGLIPTEEETGALNELNEFTEAMKNTSEWFDVDSSWPAMLSEVPECIREELSWQEIAEDAEQWEEEMFVHRLSAMDVDMWINGAGDVFEDTLGAMMNTLQPKRPPTWDTPSISVSPEAIKGVYDIDTRRSSCSFNSIAPLQVKRVVCSITDTVYNEKGHLRHFVGKWDGGEIFFTKTHGAQIVKAQQTLHRDYKGRADDPMFPPDACGDFEHFRVSHDPSKWFYVDLIQRPTDDTFPWRATWIHSSP